MIARFLAPNPTLAERFGHLLYWVFEGMALDWRRRGVTHVHHAEIALRVVGLWQRVHRVLERYRAGTLMAPRGRAEVSDPHPNPPPQGRERGRALRAVPAWSVLPRGFGWLKKLFSQENVYHVNAFYPLLHDDAEMQAVIAAAPGPIGRVLRPFCHLLGLPVPAALRLPRRVQKKKDTSPRPSPHSGEGVWALRDSRGDRIIPNRRLPAREQAEDAVRRSEASGKPIDVTKFRAEAYGWFLHPPRDGNCPPPKIGYGGRLRPLPGDYKPPRDWE